MILLSNKEREELEKKGLETVQSWRDDWNRFAFEALGARMDKEQRKIIDSVQFNPRTSVMSGTARGKDFVTGVASICFLYMTPTWETDKNTGLPILVGNTKVALTAPTGRQVKNIMQPEFARHFHAARRKGIYLPGRLVGSDIRTDDEGWFLTAFKADDHSTEAWTGFHAKNTMFAVTEASGISELTWNAIEGNLQGNSRILIVFNPNVTVGYAAKSQKGSRWTKFRLNSMDAPNIIAKKEIHPGQVDIAWLNDKLEEWCIKIRPDEYQEDEDDFEYEGQWYRPEDIFRIKVLGKFPKVSEDSLIPQQWVEAAQKRYREFHELNGYSPNYTADLRLGVDVAGEGRDSTVKCYRHANIVSKFVKSNSGGRADHMRIAGDVQYELIEHPRGIALIDTIGEGAGVLAALHENPENLGRAFSTKFSNKATDEFDNELTDVTGHIYFENKRAFLFWCVRDFLNPKNGYNAMIPDGDIGDDFLEEATEIKFYRKYNGKVMIEPKEEIKKRIGKSTDLFDSLANTFDTPQYEAFDDKSYLY